MIPIYSIDTVQKILPHRYPLLQIDGIFEHEYLKKAVCFKNITLAEEEMIEYFSDMPTYPGILIVEMGLQTTTVALTDISTLLYKNDFLNLSQVGQGKSPSHPLTQNSLPTPYPQNKQILQIDGFQFLRPITPGDALRVHSNIKSKGKKGIKALISIYDQEEEMVAKGTIVVGGL